MSYIACEYCDRMAPVSYYCETCHAVFCVECLQTPAHQERVCGSCGSNVILRDGNGLEFCQVCKSQHVDQIYRSLKVCPSCHSPTAIKIEQKKQTLVQQFYTEIQESRQLLNPVNEMVNRFNNCRQKLLLLRTQTPTSKHFPSLEPELVKVGILIEQIKLGVKERVQIFFQNVQRSRDFFQEQLMRPQDIPIVENTLLGVEAEEKELTRYIERCFMKVNEDLETIKARLNFIEEIIERFRPHLHLVDLKRQERPVFAMECTVKGGQQLDQEIGKKSGLILLTNQKIYFIHAHGMRKKKSDVLFQAAVSELENAEVRGRVFKNLHLEFNTGHYKLALEKDDRLKLLQYIEVARTFDEKNKIDQEKTQELNQLRLSGRDVRQVIEEQIACIMYAKLTTQSAPEPPAILPDQAYGQWGYNVQGSQYQGNPAYNQPNIIPPRPYGAAPNPIYPQTQASQGYHPVMTSQTYHAPPYIPQDPRNVYQPLPNQPERPVSTQYLAPGQGGYPRYNPVQPQPISTAQQSAWNLNQNSDTQVFVDEKHMILKLERDSFAIQQTINIIDQKFKNSEISQVDFLKSYRSLNQELFTIQRQLEMLREKNSDTNQPFDPTYAQ